MFLQTSSGQGKSYRLQNLVVLIHLGLVAIYDPAGAEYQ